MKIDAHARAISLYAHVPFCVRKCLYCDFVSYPIGRYDAAEYVRAILAEANGSFQDLGSREVSSVYIGGGTPTALPFTSLDELLSGLSRVLKGRLRLDAEVSIEANPGTLDEDSLQLMHSRGVTRLSIGLQSTQDRLLSIIGRIHTYDDFLGSYRCARDCGFTNINVDLIFGLPGQTMDEWSSDLARVIDLGPEHISAYSLILEDDTPLARSVSLGKLEIPSEDLAADMYELAISILTEAGYEQYEISNFARPGYRCRHNMAYWLNCDYVGIGAAAHSHLTERGPDGRCVGSKRWSNYTDIDQYVAAVQSGDSPQESVEALDEATELADTLVVGLRLGEGVDITHLRSVFSEDLVDTALRKLEPHIDRGLVICDSARLKLTYRGMLLANSVLSDLV